MSLQKYEMKFSCKHVAEDEKKKSRDSTGHLASWQQSKGNPTILCDDRPNAMGISRVGL